MPASSVSLSTISIAPMTPANAATVAPGSVPAQPGGGENSFSQWMQRAQSVSGEHPRGDGEHLPDKGNTLPAGRQGEGMQAESASASRSGTESAVSPESLKGGAGIDTEQGADSPGGVDSVDSMDSMDSLDDAGQVLNVEAGSVDGQDAAMSAGVGAGKSAGKSAGKGDGEEGAPVEAPLSEAVDGNDAVESIVQSAEAEVDIENAEQSASSSEAGSDGANEASEKSSVTEHVESPTMVATDLDGAGDAANEQATGAVETDGTAVGQQAVSAGESASGAEGQAHNGSGESQGAQRELPEQAARPEVREEARRNRGQLGAESEMTAGAHGQRVSEVARGSAKDSIEQPSVTTAETAGTAEAADAAEEGAGSAADALSATTDASDRSQEVDAAAADDVIPVATVVANQADAEARAQSTREPQGRVGAAQTTASAVTVAQSGQSAQPDTGDGQQSGGQQANRTPDQQTLSSTVSGAATHNASAVADADQSLSGGRHGSVTGAVTGTGAEAARSGAETASTAAPSNPQSLDASKSEIMSSAAMQRLQDPAWSRAMGQRAIMMAQHGPRTAEIQLDPPELGAMQIRIHLSAHDQVSVSFSSPHAAVRDAIEQQMPRLREMFAEQGLELGQSSVSDQSANGEGDRSAQARGRGGSGDYGDLDDGGESTVSLQSVPVGLVDYYA